MMTNRDQETRWVLRAQAGDREAFGELVGEPHGLIALGAHVNRNTRLILRAVELSGSREARIG